MTNLVINIENANKHDRRLAIVDASSKETNIHKMGNVDGKGFFEDHKRQCDDFLLCSSYWQQ